MPAVVLIAKHFQGCEVLFLVTGFLKDLAHVCADYCIGCENERRLALGGVDLLLVDVAGFLLGCGEDIFEGGEGFVFVFGEGGGDDFELC